MKKDLFFSILIALILVTQIDLLCKHNANSQTSIETSVNITSQTSGDAPQTVTKKREMFGLNISDFNIKSGEITAGMFIGNLFANNNISSKKATEILQKSKGIFDVRKVRRGQKYHIFYDKNKTDVVDYIIYEKNKTDYVVFNFKDSLNVTSKKKTVTTRVISRNGVINSSLWVAMSDAGIDPLLSNDLSEIYAWSIDFFGLQKKDEFKVIYEERFVDGKYIGTGKIISAFFKHNGSEIYAIPFVQDSTLSFYNLDGQSLKKEFLKAPLKFSRISSHFSNARRHPILKIVRPHHGIDYAAPMGTPVFALGDGTVIHAAYTGGAGHYIKIKHNGVYTTGYMHLKGYAKGISQGVRVAQGQLIGYVGSTGLSTGAHLDFRVWKNGQAINPLKVDAPPVEPIKPENLETFKKAVIKYKTQLNKIYSTKIASIK